MFNLKNMSTAEVQFIRTYVLALRRDHAVLKTVMDLMHPDNLGVHDVTAATRMAVELQHMQAQFDLCLHKLASTHKFFKKSMSTAPNLDDLADLFSLSFFKVLTVVSGPNTKEEKKDAGWFSGKPTEWHKLFLDIQKNEPLALSDKLSPVMKSLVKFFPQLNPFKNLPPADTPPSYWKPYKFDDQYLSGYDDEEEEPENDTEHPFDHWFDDYEDKD
jgi:hypothetical protein